MRTSWALSCALLAGCGPLYLRTQVIEFRSDEALSVKSGSWHAVDAADAPSPPKVWMQDGQGKESEFNLALCEDGTLQDGEVRVKLRAIEGQIDQGGGIVWRARDEQNYYLARWNPLEANVRVYKVVDGQRTELRDMPVQAGPGWHLLRVWTSREKIEVWLDKQSTGEFTDSTWSAPARVGLWTKADARTQFDDLEISEF